MEEDGIRGAAQIALDCAVMTQAVALGQWISTAGPRQVTPRRVLRKSDLPAAAAVIGAPLPARLRTAADVPAIHRPWCLALAAGLLRVEDGAVSAGPTLTCRPPADADFLSAWLSGLTECSAAEAGPGPDEQDDAAGDLLALLRVLQAGQVPAGQALVHTVRVQAWNLREEFGLEASFSWRANEDTVTRVAARLASFGAVSGSDVLTGGCVITPLGRWAAGRLGTLLAGPGEDLSAAELIAYLGECNEGDRFDHAWAWLDAQPDPADAARRLLVAGAPMGPRLRWIATYVAELLGADALPAWRDMVQVRGIGPHASFALHEMGAGPEPSAEQWLWLAVESAARALAESGPDEAITVLWDCLPARQLAADDLDHRVAVARASNHSSAGSLARTITEHAAAAGLGSLSVHQCLQLKVTLKRWRPPIWRTVLIPATATLTTLHQVIQVLYGWDGDHLHAFRARHETYSEPSFGLEEADDETQVRVRDALDTGGGKIVYEYDFGAGWAHEVALQRKLPRDPRAVYPVCTKFSGDSPIEYQEEEIWYSDDAGESGEPGPAKPEPFDLSAVNGKLAALDGAEETSLQKAQEGTDG